MTRYDSKLFRHLTDTLIALGPLGILLISLLDSSGVPVAGVFDALLIALSAKRPDAAWISAGLAVVGSTVGTVILFFSARRGGRRFINRAAPESRAARFRTWFRRYGLITVFIPALLPIPMPLKVFVISAGVMGTSTAQFLAVILSARILRYFGEAWLGVKLGEGAGAFMKSHAWHFVGGALTLFLVFYVYIRVLDARRQRNA